MFSKTLLKSTDQFLSKRCSIKLGSAINYCSQSTIKEQENAFKEDDNFVFESPNIFKPEQEDVVRIRNPNEIGEKLEKNTMDLPTNIDWPSTWSTAQTFDPNRVPLPVYQGAHRTGGQFRTRMNRWQNSELIKVANFLHLTPQAIKRHTDAIKKFCTKWPKDLTEEKLNELYPVTVYSTDRVHSSPSIRDPKARVVRLEINISELKLDEHAKDKLIKLLEHRYNPKTGLISIETQDCPFKEQNLELAIYQLTACYFEAWVS